MRAAKRQEGQPATARLNQNWRAKPVLARYYNLVRQS